jgi:hypothetical protein
VHVGVGRFGGRHLVFGDGQHEVHVEVLDVPLDGFLGVLAAVGHVVDAVDFQSAHVRSPVDSICGALRRIGFRIFSWKPPQNALRPL